MALWHRIGKSNLKTAYIQLSRCCSYIHPPLFNSNSSSIPKPSPNQIPHPYSFFHGRPTCVRFFAAPVQFQVKPKNDDDDDPGKQRMNDQIKAKYVRLVRDDGEHSVVSTSEALKQAKDLNLDLVEVQKNVNPPVCKIMDFHKEMYKRQEKSKERAKSKAGLRLRNECKEVRISVKTESKDISMKADMIKKLLEKGYRVKCKAMGTEDQDTMAPVCRLMALVEDVCVVESGPHLTKKEAFVIVRHVRYGLAKKGAKKLQDVRTAVKAKEGDAEQLTTSSADSVQYVNQSSTEAWSETKDEGPSDTDKQFSHLVGGSDETINGGNDSVSPAMLANRYKKAAAENMVRSNAHVPPAVTENRYKRAADENKVRSNAQVPPAVTENRYKRAEPRNRFQQTPPNTGSETRDSDRWIPLNSNRTGHVPGDSNVNPRVENTRQPFNGPPGSRNSMPLREDIPRHPRAPNTTGPGHGRFGNPNGPQTAGMHRNGEGKYQYSTWQLSGR